MSEIVQEFLNVIKNSKYKYEIKDFIKQNNIDIKTLKQDLIKEISKLNYNKYEKNIYGKTEKLKVAIWLLEEIEEKENTF